MVSTSTTQSGLSRRQMLHAMGVTGGAGITLGAMEALGLVPSAAAHTAAYRAPTSGDFHLAGKAAGTRVVVLGAGVAGLASAYELQKAGYAVTVLEARDRPGGRSWTARRGDTSRETDGTRQTNRFAEGQYMNMGPARIPQHHTTIEYCRELGVALEVFTNANADTYVYHASGGSVGGPLADAPQRRRRVKADLFGYTSELLAKAVDQGSLDDELSADDRDNLISYLRSFGALGADNSYAGSASNGFPADAEPGAWFDTGTPYAPLDRSALLAAQLGGGFSFESSWDQAMLMFQPVGGMDAIPRALAGALRRPVRYGCEVTRIADADDGVTVTYTDAAGVARRISADYCICALPPHVAKTIPSSLPADVRSALASPVPVSVGKVGLQFGRRFWEEDEQLIGGITNTNLDIGTIWYPSSGYLGPRGVVVGSYNFGADAEKFGRWAPKRRVSHTVMQGMNVHGAAYRDELENGFTVAWHKTPFIKGGWVSWPEGQSGESSAYGLLTRPSGHVYFAGDHMSHVIAWQHGAFESARATVTALHSRAVSS